MGAFVAYPLPKDLSQSPLHPGLLGLLSDTSSLSVPCLQMPAAASDLCPLSSAGLPCSLDFRSLPYLENGLLAESQWRGAVHLLSVPSQGSVLYTACYLVPENICLIILSPSVWFMAEWEVWLVWYQLLSPGQISHLSISLMAWMCLRHRAGSCVYSAGRGPASLMVSPLDFLAEQIKDECICEKRVLHSILSPICA